MISKLDDDALYKVIENIDDEALVNAIVHLNEKGILFDGDLVSVRLKLTYMKNLGLGGRDCLGNAEHKRMMDGFRLIEEGSSAISIEDKMRSLGMKVPRTEEKGLDMALEAATKVELLLKSSNRIRLN